LLIWLYVEAREGKLGMNLNLVNFVFLFLGLLLHGTPKSYLKAAGYAVKTSTGIIIQFPFYAGIMGMMKSSGLVHVFSQAFISISNKRTFPLWTFLSAGVVNLFVPSGGGQWAVQGPIMVEAAKALHVPLAKTVMALSYGDEWTNMFQPFWALPLLAITGVKAQRLVGYTFILMILVAPIFSLILLLI
jgi:short-chain fatty acids transporter